MNLLVSVDLREWYGWCESVGECRLEEVVRLV